MAAMVRPQALWRTYKAQLRPGRAGDGPAAADLGPQARPISRALGAIQALVDEMAGAGDVAGGPSRAVSDAAAGSEGSPEEIAALLQGRRAELMAREGRVQQASAAGRQRDRTIAAMVQG